MLKFHLLSASGLAILLTGAPAFAQERGGDTLIDEIIVTGTKINRSLQDTPTSVAVVTSLDIEERNIINLEDVFDRTANISQGSGGFTIRGIDSLSVSGAGLSELATIYVDGSPLVGDTTIAGPLDVWDLEQIEIFRGPQSTLQGRNSLAGAVIINTAKPTYDWTGRARAIVGTGDNERRFGVAVGGPIVEDQVAFRIAAEISKSDGFVENVTVGGEEDATEGLSIRGKLLIEPRAIEDLSVTLAYTRDEREFGDIAVSLAVDDPEDNRVSFGNRINRDAVDLDIAVATVEYDVSDELSFTSITARNQSKRDFDFDTDRTPEEVEFSLFNSDIVTWTQEARFEFDTNRFSGVVGGYYANVKTDESVSEVNINLDVINDLGLVGVLVNQFNVPQPQAEFLGSFYTDPVTVKAVSDNPYEIESYAAFADFTYNLTEDLKFFGGFRYDFETQTVVTGNEVSVISSLPDPTIFPPTLAPFIQLINQTLVAQAEAATSQAVNLESPTFKAFLPKFGLGWDIDDSRSLNFIIQKGYRSGGVGVNTARAEAYSFDQEFIWNYEASFRSQWFENALTINANAFYIDWSDQQVNVQLSVNTFDSETQNAGSSSVKGFEVETNYVINSEWGIYGSVGFADTEFQEFFARINNQVVDFSGNEFGRSPRWTLAAGTTWRDDFGWVVNVNGNYTSAAFPRAGDVQEQRIVEDHFLVNFRSGWENDHYGIFITGNNILDESYALTRFPFQPSEGLNTPEFARFGKPRTFALQLEAKF